ncbi:MAG: exo-alpha-sialidase [Acidobacteriota bacterium]|nr:exo-alpha-sialidase [Acidobacteriota bacterium]
MSEQALVATRKGVFTIGRVNGGWTVVGSAFVGDRATNVLHDSRDGTLYAAFDLGHFGVKLQRSEDGGESWDEVAAPAFSKIEDDDTAPSVSLIWELVPGGNDEPGVLWAGTIPGGLFRSSDRGESWELNESLWGRPEREQWVGGGYDKPGIHSVCVHPRDSRHLIVGVSVGGVWITRDGGESWDLKADGMFAEYMPPERRYDPIIQDPHRVVQCPTQPDALWAQHHNGVFRSTDGAASWQEVPNVKPTVAGFAVVVHPEHANTAWTVPMVKDECRLPDQGRMAVARTTDGGESFEVLTRGLPQEHCYDLVYRHALDLDASGERLVMGSTTGNLWISEDRGDSWKGVSSHLPPIYAVKWRRA